MNSHQSDPQAGSLPLKKPFPLWLSVIARIVACLVGLVLFGTNPYRDLWFYEDVATHEGFGTTTDTYIVGFALQLLTTIVFFPVAVLLIAYGIGCSRRLTFVPRFDRLTYGWGLFSSILAILMLMIEGEYAVYCVRHLHHLDTFLLSMAYIAFIYFWWCCSISHGKPRSPLQPLAPA